MEAYERIEVRLIELEKRMGELAQKLDRLEELAAIIDGLEDKVATVVAKGDQLLKALQR
jgi:hypothetical protein